MNYKINDNFNDGISLYFSFCIDGERILHELISGQDSQEKVEQGPSTEKDEVGIVISHSPMK